MRAPTAPNPSWPGAHAALCPTCNTGQNHGYPMPSHIPSCYWLCAAAYFMPQMRLIKYPYKHPYCPSLCHSWSIPMYRGCGHGMQPPQFLGSPSLLGGLRSPLIPEGVYELSSEPTVSSPILAAYKDMGMCLVGGASSGHAPTLPGPQVWQQCEGGKPGG